MENYKELSEKEILELRDHWLNKYQDITEIVKFIVDNFGDDTIVNRREYRIWTGQEIPGMTNETVFDLILTREDILFKAKSIGAVYSAFVNVTAKKDHYGWTFREFGIMMNVIKAGDVGEVNLAKAARKKETGIETFEFITPSAWARKVLEVFPELKKTYDAEQLKRTGVAASALFSRLNLDRADDFRKGK